MSEAKRLSEERLQEFKDHADSSGGYILEKEIYRHIAFQQGEIARLEAELDEVLFHNEGPHGCEIVKRTKERDLLRKRVEKLRHELGYYRAGGEGSIYAFKALDADDELAKGK